LIANRISRSFLASEVDAMRNLHDHHDRELAASLIDPSIRHLNWETISGTDAWTSIWQHAKPDRFIQDGHTPRDSEKRRYAHLSEGGLWCDGCDPIERNEMMVWGQLKPTTPRQADGKTIKYESPLDCPTRATFLRVSLEIWQKVAERSGVELPAHLEPSPNGYGLEFWDWVREHPEVTIVPTEGAKKAGCLLSHGHVSIALPSVYNAFIPQTTDLKPELEHFAQAGRKFAIAYDCDAKRTTRRSVAKQARKLHKALSERGCTVEIASWNPATGKGIDDYAANGGDLNAAIALAEPLEAWSNRIDGGEITYPTEQLGTIEVQGRRYLAPIAPPEDRKFWFLKAGKGLGKTEVVARKLAILREAHPGRPILVLTHRVQLGRALAGRFGVEYLDDIRNEIARVSGAYAAETGGMTLCVDSLHNNSGARFSPEWWENAIVVIDEVEQFCWHLLSAATDVRRNRPEIIENLAELLQRAWLVIAMDADLTDVSIDYLLELHDDKAIVPWIGVCDERPSAACTAYIYDDTKPTNWFADLLLEIGSGGKPFVGLSGQKANSKWGTQHLEHLISQRFPGIKIGRIDGESVATTGHDFYASLDDLDPKLADCDVILATGVIETGVSIDLRGHFTSKWICSWGLQTESGVRQFAERVRESIPLHLWAIARSPVGSVAGGSCYPSILRRKIESTVARAKAKALEATSNADEALALQLQKADDLSTRELPSSTRAWSRFAARINAGAKYYRRSIAAGLQRDGYTIRSGTHHPEAVCDRILEDMTDSLEAFETEVNERIVKKAATRMDDGEFERLDKAREMTSGDRERLYGERLRRRYGIAPTRELVYRDRRGYHSEISLHYWLTRGREFVEALDHRRIVKAAEFGAFTADLAASLKAHRIEGLEWLGMPKLLEDAFAGRIFKGDDPELLALKARAIAASRDTTEKAQRQLGRWIALLRETPNEADRSGIIAALERERREIASAAEPRPAKLREIDKKIEQLHHMPSDAARDAQIAEYLQKRRTLNARIQGYARELFALDVERAKPLTVFHHLLRRLGLTLNGSTRSGYTLSPIDDPRFEIFETWHAEHAQQLAKWHEEAVEELQVKRERAEQQNQAINAVELTVLEAMAVAFPERDCYKSLEFVTRSIGTLSQDWLGVLRRSIADTVSRCGTTLVDIAERLQPTYRSLVLPSP
jgi:hypothetical protein